MFVHRRHCYRNALYRFLKLKRIFNSLQNIGLNKKYSIFMQIKTVKQCYKYATDDSFIVLCVILDFFVVHLIL